MPRLPLLALILTVSLTACGGGGGAADADPTKAVPAGTAVYIEGVLRPQGDTKEDVLDAARKVLRTDDPEKKIHAFVNQALKESDNGPLSYEKDFEPWLGQRAGVWVSGIDSDKPGYAVLIATSDTEKAQQAIDDGLKREGKKAKPRSFEGVDYQVDSDGVAAGIVGDFFTVGTEAEFKRTVKALDGDSLADDKRYKQTVGELEENRLGHFYLDLKPFIEQALKANPQASQQIQQFKSVFPVDKLGPVAGALIADGDRLAVDAVATGSGANALTAFGLLTGTGTTPLLGELPGDSWAAVGAPKVGQSLKGLFDRVAGAFGGAAAAQQLKQQYGLDLQQDVFGLIGDLALFVRGSTQADVDGGLVIEVTDPDRAERTFGKVAGLLRSQGGMQVAPTRVKGAASAFRVSDSDLDKPIVLARTRDRWIVAYGEKAAADGLGPSEKLGDSALYDQAKKTLGGDYEPSFLLSMPAILTAVENNGEADADYAKAKPYLDAFSVITGGSETSDDRVEARLAAGLK